MPRLVSNSLGMSYTKLSEGYEVYLKKQVGLEAVSTLWGPCSCRYPATFDCSADTFPARPSGQTEHHSRHCTH